MCVLLGRLEFVYAVYLSRLWLQRLRTYLSISRRFWSRSILWCCMRGVRQCLCLDDRIGIWHLVVTSSLQVACLCSSVYPAEQEPLELSAMCVRVNIATIDFGRKQQVSRASCNYEYSASIASLAPNCCCWHLCTMIIAIGNDLLHCWIYHLFSLRTQNL